jgi:ferredoxin-NADP reductase
MHEASAPRRRIKEMETMVADVVNETPDTTTLVLFTGNDRLDYQAGHFLTIDPHQFPSLQRFVAYFEDIKGKKEPARAYSMASAPHEKYLAITIKEERYVSGTTKYPPLLSPLLVKRTLKGMRLVITGFTGPYVLAPDIESKTDHLVHVTAGSGVVPNFSILKHALTNHPKLRHTFVYSNKTWDDIIFRRELDELAQKHPDRVKLLHALTREDPPSGRSDVRKGRVDVQMLKDAIPDPSSCIVYTCGPANGPHEKAAAKAKGTTPTPRFLETVLTGLEQIGVPEAHIEYESYG